MGSAHLRATTRQFQLLWSNRCYLKVGGKIGNLNEVVSFLSPFEVSGGHLDRPKKFLALSFVVDFLDRNTELFCPEAKTQISLKGYPGDNYSEAENKSDPARQSEE